MKKKILFVILLLVATVVSFQLDSKREKQDRLMLENIEALASDEWNDDTFCIGNCSADCLISCVKVKYVIEI